MNDRYMTIDEAAAYLRLSRETLYKYVQRGVMPAAKIGRHWRFDKVAIDRWIASQTDSMHADSPVPASVSSPVTSSGDRMRVLVVDDDPAIRQLLRVWIQGEGCEVDLAADGGDAMQRLTTIAYDLVFLDLQMPDLTGGQVLGRLQEYERRPPVVLITGFSGTPMMEQALHYDLLYVLSKPFDRQQVLKLLHSVRATLALPFRSSIPDAAAPGAPVPVDTSRETV